MPTQSEAIKFYRGFLKIAPDVAKKPQHEAMPILQLVFATTFAVEPTREHILNALAGHRKNTQKRKWDLKQQFIVAQLLRAPSLSTGAIESFVKQRFGQRTRPTVIESCREAAAEIVRTKSTKEIDEYCTKVHVAVDKRSGDVDVLT